MFHHGKKFHGSKAHLLDVGNQPFGNFPIGQVPPVPRPAPGAKVQLVDIQRLTPDVPAAAKFQPRPVIPVVAGQIKQLGADTRPGLGMESEGVGLPDPLAGLSLNQILIAVKGLQTGGKALPNAAGKGVHGVVVRRPAVEGAGNMDGPGVRRPDTKKPAGLLFPPGGMRTEKFVCAVTAAAQKSINVGTGQGLYCLHVVLSFSSTGRRPLHG